MVFYLKVISKHSNIESQLLKKTIDFYCSLVFRELFIYITAKE